MPQKLDFFDIKAKKKFETDKYEVVEKATSKGVVVFAVATSPYTGVQSWRIIKRKEGQ